VLHDTTRLKHTWHEAKISTTVHYWAVIEEFIRFTPEAIRVVHFQSKHSVCTIGRVRLSSIRWASNQKLDSIVILLNDLLCNIKDHVNTFLLGHSANECK
jgi:hypothetical protein